MRTNAVVARTSLATIACTLAVGLQPLRPAAAPPQNPDAGERVTLEVRAVLANRRPVTGLRAEQITLEVGGTDRPVLSFEYVPTPTDRTIFLAFDDQTIRLDRSAQNAAAEFLGRLDPSDRVGLVSMTGLTVPVTTDRQAIVRSLDRLRGAPSFPHDRTCRSPDGGRPILTRLVDFLETFTGVPGPKTVIFISGGVPSASISAIDCALMMQNVTRAVALGRVSLYVIESLEGLAGPELMGLQDLTAVTGGALFRHRETAPRAFDQILAEIAGYYRLEFETLPAERDGSRHSVRLVVRDAPVYLRHRRWMVVSSGSAAAGRRN